MVKSYQAYYELQQFLATQLKSGKSKFTNKTNKFYQNTSFTVIWGGHSTNR